MKLSIIISVYNESGNLRELYRRITGVIAASELDCEILFVDDGSKDNSFEEISEIAKSDPGVVALKFSRNFGHEYAMQAGLSYSRGDAAILMDSDLQHPAELIPEIMKQLEKYDVVFCKRSVYRASIVKRICSWSFYLLFNSLSNVNLIPGASDFYGLRKRVVDTLRNLPERDRFLRGLLRWSGFSHTYIDYVHDKRGSGRSKYGFIKLFELTLDSLLSFSNNPLRKLAFIGIIIAFLSFVYVAYIIILFLFFGARLLPGWATIVVSVLFLGGLNLAGISLLGEYLARIYGEIKQRPLYIVDKIVDARPS